MRTKQQSSQRKISWAGKLIMLAVIFLFSCSQKILAQQWSTSANGTDISNTNSGNVGVGTSSPANKLDVVSSSGTWTARFKKSDASHGGILIDSAAGFNPNIGLSVNGAYKWFLMSNSSNGDALQFWESTGMWPRLSISQAGNVGIASTNPLGQLHLGYTAQVAAPKTWTASSSNGRGLVIDSYQENAAPFKQFVDFAAMGDQNATQGGSVIRFLTNPVNSYTLAERMRIDNAGNVGIGTASPTRQLTISGAYQADIALISQDKGTSVANGFNLQQSGFHTLLINREAGSMSFWTNSVQQMTILSSGNVGIGTTSDPTERLEVNGNIKLTGTINAKYQDVAEWVPSSEQIPTGTVVVLDSTKSNQVISSTQAYDTRVAGVVSKQPGIVLGESGQGKVLVATTGRVKVKVDASNGPVNVGDLLVTSDIPGVAMKSVPVKVGGVRIHRPGTLIGKALEPLAQGNGEILVLLSLQ